MHNTNKQTKPNVIVNRFEKRTFPKITPGRCRRGGRTFVGGVSNNYRLVREAVDRGVPLHQIDPNANVIQDLRKIILPEEWQSLNRASAALCKSASLS